MHSGLALYRNQLRDAIERDLDRRRSRVRALALAVPTAAATVAAAGLVAFSGGGAVQSADAAVLRHVTAALTGPPHTVLHERALVTLGSRMTTFEVWQQSDPPYAYRVRKWGHEGTGQGRPSDPAATLRALVASGQATVDADTSYNGVPAYKLTVTGAPDRWLNGTAYVSKRDYQPLHMETNGESITFETYEYVPNG